MMAVDAKDRVMLVRQYRMPADRFLWELPAGKSDEGETVLQAARRELIEETGLRAKKWKKLVSFYPSPGFVEEKMTIFLATDLTQGESQPMDDERIETRWFTKKELRELDRVEPDSRCEDDDRVSLLDAIVVRRRARKRQALFLEESACLGTTRGKTAAISSWLPFLLPSSVLLSFL